MGNIQDTLYSKMSPGLSVPTTEQTSRQSSKRSAKSKTKEFIYLNLQRANGHTPDTSWAMITQLPGDSSTASIGVFRSVENESTLSQILQVGVPERFYLSEMACRGILRRASERGKKLPPVLEKALKRQAHLA